MNAIDLFAGLGGFTEAAHLSGLRCLWAANHWREAVDAHARLHPDVAHTCQDLHQCDWHEVPRHDVLLASPACQGHARARGRERPHHDAARSTAWAVVSCVEVHRPPLLVVENVPEFRDWVLYPAWRSALHALGYSLAEVITDAADAGVPQHRVRLFVIGTRSLVPVTLRLPRRDHVAARTFVDVSGSSAWSLVTRPGRAHRTIERVERGRCDHGDSFLVSYYGATRGGRSLDRPIGTITTRDRWAVVVDDRMRMLSPSECALAMGFGAEAIEGLSAKIAVHMLGNAVCPRQGADVIRAALAAA